QAYGRRANAKSAVALMSLGIRRGDEMTLIASGPDARRAVDGLKQVILGLVDEPHGKAAPKAPAAPAPASAPRIEAGRLRGVIASRGLAVGRAVTLKAAEVAVVETGRGIGHESSEFERARTEVRARLEQLAQQSQATAREVIAAHLEFLDDWELVAA